MPNKEKYEKYYKKKTPKKVKNYDAVTWLEEHPEDIPMARENLDARDRGFDNDGIRNLFAAMSLRSCSDYNKAARGVRVDNKDPDVVIEECRKFFDGDIFQLFINRIPTEEVERHLRDIPGVSFDTLMKVRK